MKGSDMKKINRLALRGVMGVGKAALSCLGLLAMLALVVVIAVLTPVMLAATALPATKVWRKRDPMGRRHGANTSELSAPRKAVAS